VFHALWRQAGAFELGKFQPLRPLYNEVQLRGR